MPIENKPNTNNYVYIFVRKDLPTKEQITVQSCHAAIETSRHYIDSEIEHPSLVILQLANEKDLEDITLYLSNNGIKCKGFYEEFYNNSLTAIATEMISGKKRSLMRQFELLKFEETNVKTTT